MLMKLKHTHTYICTHMQAHMLMKLQTRVPDERKRGVVYEAPCKECRKTYVGETKKTLRKQALKKGNPKNGIAVHAHETQHEINWNGAEVKKMEAN